MPLYHHKLTNEEISAIPTTFTSNTSISGYVCSASIYNSSNPPWHVWKRDYTTSEWAWWTGDYPTFPVWIQIEVPEAFVPSAFCVSNEVASPANMKSFIFQGSNDNSTWTDLYEVNNWPNTAGFKSIMELSTSISFKYFRLYITETSAGVSGVSIQAMEIFRKEISISGFDAMGSSVQHMSAKDAQLVVSRWVDENTVLYIPMYGKNPFADQSKNNYTVVNTGVTYTTQDHPKKASGAAKFTAANQFLCIYGSNIMYGLTQFTLQFDFRFTSIPSGNSWEYGYYVAASGPNYADAGTDLFFGSSVISINFNGYSGRRTIAYSPDTNWHKFKFSRNALNTVNVLIDDVLLFSWTSSASFNNNNTGFAIGRTQPTGEVGTGFRGYIANYRISNIAR